MLKVKKEAEKEAELQQKIQELLAVVFSKDFDINHFISSQPCWSTSGGIWEANPWTQETTIRIWSNFFAISYKQNLQELRETILWIVFYVQIFLSSPHDSPASQATAVAETQAVTCLQVANNKHRVCQVSQYFLK